MIWQTKIQWTEGLGINMQKTNIPWCTHTWNPAIGCSLPLVSEGCLKCYARKLHNGRHKAYLEGKKLPEQYAKPYEEVQLLHNRLDEPLKCRAENAKIFVGSMTDLFGPEVPFEFIDKVFAIMALCPQHTFQCLTKRIDRALDFLYQCYGPFPNVHFGVTVCTQKEADEKIPVLLQIPAAVRFVSLEPMLEGIDLAGTDESRKGKTGYLANYFTPFFCNNCGRHLSRAPTSVTWNCNYCAGYNVKKGRGIDWVIVGGESGPKRRLCKHQWALKIVKQCKAANVPCFVKQLQENDSGKNKVIKMPYSWPQEYPK